MTVVPHQVIGGNRVGTILGTGRRFWLPRLKRNDHCDHANDPKKEEAREFEIRRHYLALIVLTEKPWNQVPLYVFQREGSSSSCPDAALLLLESSAAYKQQRQQQGGPDAVPPKGA